MDDIRKAACGGSPTQCTETHLYVHGGAVTLGLPLGRPCSAAARVLDVVGEGRLDLVRV